MKPSTFWTIAALAWTVTNSIVGAALVYVVRIEHRITRVETILEHRTAPAVKREPPRDLKA
ncbi:MAG TPA: hypothetical protein VED01_07825 [Burkholderiales bacterium]|nr:hypothetical protein [Burkholderiales bacterium]